MPRTFARVGVLACTIVGLGCGADVDRSSSDELTVTAQPLLGCDAYSGYTAALAEATIECTGTIGPNSFVVDALGLLGRNFSTCPAASGGDPLLQIDRLLSLQLRGDLPLGVVCFAEAWSTWLLTALAERTLVCPVWTKLGSTGSPTPQNVAANIATLPSLPGAPAIGPVPLGKEQFLYAVAFPSPLPLLQRCRTPQACAKTCSGGLAGFFVGLSGNNVVGDPYWWLDPNDYGWNSPYRDGYYHPMSYAPDDVPGAIYGDWARRGEACSLWNGVQHVYATLWEDKLDPSNWRTWTSRCDY